jgi:hypothetical protein
LLRNGRDRGHHRGHGHGLEAAGWLSDQFVARKERIEGGTRAIPPSRQRVVLQAVPGAYAERAWQLRAPGHRAVFIYDHGLEGGRAYVDAGGEPGTGAVGRLGANIHVPPVWQAWLPLPQFIARL